MRWSPMIAACPLLLHLCTTLVLTDAKDWLIHRDAGHDSVVKEHVCWKDGLCGIELTNGLLTRRFALEPAFGTVDFLLHSETTTSSMFRAMEPEATVVLDNVEYHVGGLVQDEKEGGFRAYFNRTSPKLTRNETAFHYISHRVSYPKAPFPWVPGTRHSLKLPWPPKGITLSVTFGHPDPTISTQITMHYESYNGMPCMAKWMTVEGNVMVNSAAVERLAVNAPYGPYLGHGSKKPMAAEPLLYAITDQAHGASCHWEDDFVNSQNQIGNETWHDEGAVEPLLVCSYTMGPAVRLKEPLESFKVILLAMDEFSDATSQSLSIMRMMQLLAPHVTENPIFFHATSVEDFDTVVNQMAEVGFEMLIYSFGSGFDLENVTQIQQVKKQVQYAKSRGLEVGGYDLICLDRGKNGYGGNVGDEWAAVGKDGNLSLDACFASGWYDKILGLATTFIKETGLSNLETDGPYGGGACASTNHAHHNGWEDSVYQQTRLQNEYYKEMRSLGVYVNQPDTYFFQGGNRDSMGYSEEQYSLPRWQDLSISRMGLYDDLYRFLPTQGWMFVPLEPYHRGGDAAAFQGHHVEYEWALAQYMGAGTAACYRGKVLYNETTAEGKQIKAIARKWVKFYKAHRETLIQPVVHLKRPTMQSWDGWLHVNPFGTSRDVGLAVVFNPTDHVLQENVRFPLYYTGLDWDAIVVIDGGRPMIQRLNRDYSITLNLTMKPRSIRTIVVQRERHQESNNQ